jgi:hypothetical protein
MTEAGLGEKDCEPRSPTMSIVLLALAGGGVGAAGLAVEPPEPPEPPPQLELASPTSMDPTQSEERITASFPESWNQLEQQA